MSNIDLVVLGIFVIFAAIGFFRGFIVEILAASKWIASFVLAFMFKDELARLIFDQLKEMGYSLGDTMMFASVIEKVVIESIAFIIILFGVRIIFGVLMNVFKLVNEIPIIGFFSRVGGAFVGFLKGYLLVFVFALFVSIPSITWDDNIDSDLFTFIQNQTNVVSKDMLLMVQAVREPEMMNENKDMIYEHALNDESVPVDETIDSSIRMGDLIHLLDFTSIHDTEVSTNDIVDHFANFDSSYIKESLENHNLTVDEFVEYIQNLGVNQENIQKLVEKYNQ